MIDTYTSIKR